MYFLDVGHFGLGLSSNNNNHRWSLSKLRNWKINFSSEQKSESFSPVILIVIDFLIIPIELPRTYPPPKLVKSNFI